MHSHFKAGYCLKVHNALLKINIVNFGISGSTDIAYKRHKQIDRQRDKETDRQTDKLTERQRGRETNQGASQTNRQKDRKTDRQTERKTDPLVVQSTTFYFLVLHEVNGPETYISKVSSLTTECFTIDIDCAKKHQIHRQIAWLGTSVFLNTYDWEHDEHVLALFLFGYDISLYGGSYINQST